MGAFFSRASEIALVLKLIAIIADSVGRAYYSTDQIFVALDKICDAPRFTIDLRRTRCGESTTPTTREPYWNLDIWGGPNDQSKVCYNYLTDADWTINVEPELDSGTDWTC